ncbi:MAG: hypothetical protein H6728_05955 [Myxococcales bacterium]|nr:hypothetical protein [Myxococcales bacterium]
MQDNASAAPALPLGRLRGLLWRVKAHWKLALAVILVLQVLVGIGYKLLKKDTFIFRSTAMYMGDQLTQEGQPAPKIDTVMAMVKTMPRLQKLRKSLQLKAKIKTISQMIQVKKIGKTRMFEVIVVSDKKKMGEHILDFFIKDFLQETNHLWESHLEQRERVFRKALVQRRAALQQVRVRLSSLEQRTGYMGAESSLKSALQEKRSAFEHLHDAQVRFEGLEVEIQGLERSMKRLPKRLMLQETRRNPLLEQYVSVEAEFQALRHTLTRKHPRMRALLAKRAAFHRQMGGSNLRAFWIKTQGVNPIFQKLQEQYLLKKIARDALSIQIKLLKAETTRLLRWQRDLPKIAQEHQDLALRKDTLAKIVSALEVTYAGVLTEFHAKKEAVKVVEPPHFFAKKSAKKKRMILFGILGFLPVLVFLVLAVNALRDDTLRYTEEVEGLGVPVFGPMLGSFGGETLAALQLYTSSFPESVVVGLSERAPDDELEQLVQQIGARGVGCTLRSTEPFFSDGKPQVYHFQAHYGGVAGRILWVRLGKDKRSLLRAVIKHLQFDDRLILLLV